MKPWKRMEAKIESERSMKEEMKTLKMGSNCTVTQRSQHGGWTRFWDTCQTASIGIEVG